MVFFNTTLVKIFLIATHKIFIVIKTVATRNKTEIVVLFWFRFGASGGWVVFSGVYIDVLSVFDT